MKIPYLRQLSKNPNPHKIALTGKMRSGKDTVAGFFYEEGYWPFAFGTPIKRHIDRMFPDKNEREKRQLYQWYGQKMRNIDEDVWVRLLFDRLKDAQRTANFRNVMITDLRQPNEYNRLVSENFLIIRVNASEDVRIKRMEDESEYVTEDELNHETEQYVDLFPVHYDLYNNGTLDDLFTQVERIINSSHSPA